jgi:hypothetical protein
MKHHQWPRGWLGSACAVAVLCGIASIGATGARADDVGACPNSVDAPYSMQLKALTGPGGADLTVGVVADAASKCAVPDAIKKIQLKTFDADGTLASTRNITDVPAAGGVTNVDLGQVPRDRRVEATVLLQAGAPSRTFVVHGTATTLLRPDLVVQEIIRPKQALVGTSFTVQAVIAELNGDVGASADVALSAVPGAVQHVDVPAGGSTTVSFSVAFSSPVPVEVTATVSGASTAETDVTNNTRTATIDITASQLASPYTVLFPSLLGYGAQFNHHLYAPITAPLVPPGEYPDVEAKVKQLQPELVRIFYNDNWEENQDKTHPEYRDNYASFVKVVQLAQESGATIDIGYQNLGNLVTRNPPFLVPDMMSRFAAALEDLVKNYGLTNVRWAEVANEPNSGAVTLEQYKALCQALKNELVARGLGDQIHIMGGGLVENANSATRNHYEWMKWIAANVGNLVDGYAEHVYWNYNDTGRLEYRLRDTYNLMKTVLPPEQQKPVYMMEYGVRGLIACPGKPTRNTLPLYYAADPNCPEIWRTNLAGFQQFWFDIGSAQLGVAGAAKWDAYWAVYDRTSQNAQVYWMIGPASENYALTPTYHAMSLLFHSTTPGWQIIQVEPWQEDDWKLPEAEYRREGHSAHDQPEQELVAYAGPNGELTVTGLDTHGKDLNVASTDPPSSYSIGGLPPNTSFSLAVWNATGDGTNSIAGTVTTNAAGVARFEVPIQAAFALTTVPVA